MKSTMTTFDYKARMRSVLRTLADIVSDPIYANYTHSGPSSLPTGQAGAAGRMAGPYIGQDFGNVHEHPDRVGDPLLQASGIELAIPLKQVFWI